MQSTRGSLWDFVKGWTPPRVRFQRSGWGSFGFGLISPQAREDAPEEKAEEKNREEVEKRGRMRSYEQRKGRFTLPTKKRMTPRPNVNKVIQAIRKKNLDPIKASAALEKDYSANSSRAATKSRRSTVARLLGQKYPHRSWLPANEEVIRTLAAILKEAGYKSAKLYLSELKLIHLEAGHEWSGPMTRTLAQCQNAATRGRGPKKKAIEVPEDVWADESKKDDSKKIKVVGARRLFALGVQWMMREIEIADFKVKNFSFNPGERTVSITWDSSKTDPEAASITRVLQCLCGNFGKCNIRCPYYNLECIVGTARGMGATEDDYICMDKSGDPASKNQVLNSWRVLFGKGVTGHSTRRSGALQYIRKGWSVSQVAFLGRWRSNIILQYADEALQSIPVNASANFNVANHNTPVISQTSIPKDPVIQQEIVLELREEIRRLKAGGQSVENKLKDLQEKWHNKPSAGGRELPRLIVSLKSRVVHYNASLLLCAPPYTWRTSCGWNFYTAAYSFAEEPMEITCQKCLQAALMHGGKK